MNPWLAVSLADYEGHMGSAGVQQLDALSDLFAEALDYCRPPSVAILGIAGGNGLERLDPAITRRVVGVDLNRSYLDTVRHRFAGLHGLELHCADLSQAIPSLQPVNLVHAALVFEHAGTGKCLENALALIAPGGCLSVVLQLPSRSAADVGASPFPSMQSLGAHFSLVDPGQLAEAVEPKGFRLCHQSGRQLPAGKAFWMGIFTSAK